MSTPMFEQYQSLKDQLRSASTEAILFFRMGDFYETFFEDAVIAAEILDLTLTSRNKSDPEPVPMAGVPHHAAGAYIEKLVAAGHRVAIAEQTEDPRAAKGLVRREIVRIVTPGVGLDPSTLERQQPCWLVGLWVAAGGVGDWGVAFLDISTGALRVTVVGSEVEVVAELHRMEPREVVLAPAVASGAAEGTVVGRALRGVIRSSVEPESWDPRVAARELCETLGVADLRGFGMGAADEPGVRAAGALVRYARDTLGSRLRNLHHLDLYRVAGFMVLDDTTRRNLELFRTLLGGTRTGSLVHLLDRTGTSMGSRLLREWLSFPLVDPARVADRSDAVEALSLEPGLREGLRLALGKVADLERIGARVGQGTAHARDLVALRTSLEAIPEVNRLASALRPLAPHLPVDPIEDLFAELSRWLVDDPPLAMTEGGIIRRGAHAELDALVHLSLEGVGVIGELEEKERAASGIASLKIRRNQVFGYYIEITQANLHRVPAHYLRKQTLTHAERYVTPELKELEERILGADERRKALEYTLFVALRDQAAARSARLLAAARRIAALDVLCTLAEVAVRNRWVRPAVDGSTSLRIVGGRHPMVEEALRDERFVPNDLELDTGPRQLVVLTGPNMSGKSTIMRQVALLVLLAQIGSFVPADSAQVGICDRIFTRVGAADDLARGQSTFMVEMSETAAILHHASGRSLVVLDEIGRGTSTYDGLAIAWAVAEDLVDRVRCRTLFATHYHELCDLPESREGVVNQSVAVSEHGDQILFLRKLKEGGASRSYGIQCARLAGLPGHVVRRATALLQRFEKHAPRNERQQLSLFGSAGAPEREAAAPPAPPPDPVREALLALDPDRLSPREALDAVYRLRALIAASASSGPG